MDEPFLVLLLFGVVSDSHYQSTLDAVYVYVDAVYVYVVPWSEFPTEVVTPPEER